MVVTRQRFSQLFRNMGFILALAFIIGLALPQGAPQITPTVTPLLALIMTLSITGVSPKLFLNFKVVSRPILVSLLLNYGVLTFTLIGLASLFIGDYELWVGFVILAAVPPAVAVIPFTYRLDGDINFSLIGTVASYLAALFITPLISIAFVGTSLIQPGRLLMTLGELIAIPFGVAYLLRRTGVAPRLEKYRGTIINWGFFVVVYTIVGLNQDAFLAHPVTLVPIVLVAFVTTFGLGYLIDRLARFLGRGKPNRISLIFLGTRKNYGMAAAIALALFGPRGTIPAAVATVFAVVHFVWLSYWVKRMV